MMDYLTEVRNRINFIDNRRMFIDDSVIESAVSFATTFIQNNLLQDVDQSVIDNAIVELATFRCLLTLISKYPDLKSAYEKTLELQKSVVKASLKGVIPDDLILSILEDHKKPITSKVELKLPIATRDKSMITYVYMWKYWKIL